MAVEMSVTELVALLGRLNLITPGDFIDRLTRASELASYSAVNNAYREGMLATYRRMSEMIDEMRKVSPQT